MNDLIKVYVLVSFYDERGLHKAGTITEVPEEEFNENYMKKLPDIPSGSSSLEELTDVEISSVEDGQILMYDAATQKWVNVSGGAGGSIITNIYEDTDTGNVASMEIDGTYYEFGAGETTIEDIQTDGSFVESMEIDGTEYEFGTGESTILDIQESSDGFVSSMEIDGNTKSFSTVENVQTDANDLVESVDINGTTYSFGTAQAIENVVESTKNKVTGFDVGSDSLSFVNLVEDLEDVDVSSVSDGDTLIYNAQNQTWEAGSAGGGGGGSLVVTLTPGTGVTVNFATMTQSQSVILSSNKTYAEIKAVDDVIFKVVDTSTPGQKWTFKPTACYTLNVSGDQSIYFTFCTEWNNGSALKIFKCEVSPWSQNVTITCLA